MPVVNYHSANGRLIGETTSGVRTDYMSDALGSVTGTLNASQAVVNTYRYKPYGDLLAKTGSAADPAFMWNGTTQSRRTGLNFSDQYNRARHYGTRQGQWTTVDPLWPSELAYVYVSGNPIRWTDHSGLKINVDKGCGTDFGSGASSCCDKFNESLIHKSGKIKPDVLKNIRNCMADKGYPNSDQFITEAIRFFGRLCSGPPNFDLCVKCNKGKDYPGGTVLPKGCGDCANAGAFLIMPFGEGINPPPDSGCYWDGPWKGDHPCAPLNSPGCACTVIVCTTWPTSSNLCSMLFHEAIHCGGVSGPPGHSEPGVKQTDIIYALGCCLCREVYGEDADCHQCKDFPKS